jgi:hypothetical protein
MLPAVLYGCETWFLSLREEHSLWVLQNMVLKRKFGAKRKAQEVGEKRIMSFITCKSQVKLSPLQAVEAYRAVRC